MEHVPNVLFIELARLMELPSPLPVDPAAHLVLQTVAARAAADAVELSPSLLKPAPLALLQDSLALQLDAKLPHCPAQLAAASQLYAAVTAHAPPAALPRSSALVLSSSRAAVAAPQGAQSAAEVLRTCDHCTQQLCTHAEISPPQPPPLPAAACTTLAVDPSTGTLVATGAAPAAAASEQAIQALQQSGAVNACASNR